MNKKLFFLLLFSITCHYTFAQYPAYYGIPSYKYGIMTTEGEIITPAQYDDVDLDLVGSIDSEQHIVVEKDRYYGVIGSDGKQIGDIKYDKISAFARPMYEVYKNGKVGFLDKTGKEAIPCIYDDYSTTDDINEWYKLEKDGKYGMVDSSNNIILPFEYSRIYNYEDDPTFNIALQKDGKYALFHRKNGIVTPFIYDNILLFNNGGGIAARDTCYYFLSSSGKEVACVPYERDIKDMKHFVSVTINHPEKEYGLQEEYTFYSYDGKRLNNYNGIRISSFSSGNIASIRTRVEQSSSKTSATGISVGNRSQVGYMLIDTLGQLISTLGVDPPYDRELYGLTFVNGYAVAADRSGLHGVIDTKGKTIVPFKYHRLEAMWYMFRDNYLNYDYFIIRDRQFKEGILSIKKGEITPVKYKNLFCYNGKFFKGSIDGKAGIISMDGQEISPFVYDEIWGGGNDIAVLEQNKKFGFLNVATKAKIDPIYDDWRYAHFGECNIVEKDGKKGVINSDCKVVLDCIYKGIELTTNGYIIATNEDGVSAIFDTKGKIVRPFGKEGLFYFHKNLLVYRIKN